LSDDSQVMDALRQYNESIKEGAFGKYDTGAAFKGNGMTIYDRNQSQGGDYKNIAHIGEDGKLTIWDKNIKKEPKLMQSLKKISQEFKTSFKESVNEAYGDLNDNGFKKVRKYNTIVIKLVKKLENAVRRSEGKDAVKWIRGLYDAVGIMYDTIGHKMYYESINEKVAKPFSEHLRKAQNEIEYMISNGPTPDGDDGVYDKPNQAMKLLQIAQKSLGKIK